MAKIELGRVRNHFGAARANNGIGTEKPADVRDTVEQSLGEFSQQVYTTRQGLAEDGKGRRIAPYDVSLGEAVADFFGCTLPQFYRALGIYSGSDTIFSVAQRFGVHNLSGLALEGMLVEHSNFGNAPANTGNIGVESRFIIPELILNAVRTGYQVSAQHPNWIAATQNLSQMSVTMPQILRGNAMPSRVNEGADIPLGTVRFGQKKADVYKVGTGFQITDELIMTSALDMIFLFMQEVGTYMSIGADVAAMDCLINGEQANGSESAPVVGVSTIGQFQYRDLKKVFTRLARLGTQATRIIAGEDDGIDITAIDRFEGFQGGSKLADIKTIIGVPDKFTLDTFTLPPDQILFLNAARAMAKLQFSGMKVEKRRNPQNQSEELFVSDFINYAIIKRDARVLLDKSVSITTNPFPAYMDVDKLTRAGFRQD